jgi:acylphosphatase
VGFRLFVLREANARSITGFVRNMECADGVEVVACGEASVVEDFVARLRIGAPGALVRDVTTQCVGSAPRYPDFSVRY